MGRWYALVDILPDLVFYADTYSVYSRTVTLTSFQNSIFCGVGQATSVVDECLFRLGDKGEKMGDFVEKLKKLRTEVEAEVPNHPSIETGDVIGEHFAISKPDKKNS
ncbi:hypothetical protein CTI12_AA498760 [Artemisia annua]|uniref:Uncharacterized protein n=1 Tax=Artemisia annua TaxID=35608 RepID=A0A2U1LEY0_ARTAN|nr:hypothetical protein CTI12_AA498760 [Artemisia annua]